MRVPKYFKMLLLTLNIAFASIPLYLAKSIGSFLFAILSFKVFNDSVIFWAQVFYMVLVIDDVF